ncbi:hypothetical protein E1295_09960 [Nonomuraea mesophila]|uniref:Uncharacterized protein n=1 Tax=Nonomuraea mesophila TaxID=2530382 RepID=A0A4R5FUH5_9ACTN|nr:hypothetical protein [Nonomuraea mesophila]TDE56715.1 hypothetical protein E1295_09960 [Nonomuraea mesophila]
MVVSKGGGNQWMSIYLADGLKQSKDKIIGGSPRPSKAYWNRGWDAADAGKFQKYAGPVRDYDNGSALIKANIKRRGTWYMAYWRG